VIQALMAVDEASAAGVAAVAADAGPTGRGVLAPRGRHAPTRRVRAGQQGASGAPGAGCFHLVLLTCYLPL
jgi:hypothetical protein